MKNSPPEIKTPDHIAIPAAESLTLPNGVTVYTLDCSDQDVIRFSFVFRAGTSLQNAPFAASSTANLLNEGSTLHSAHEIAEILDYHGSYFDVSLDRDYAVLNFVALLKYFPQTLAIADEILLKPAFEEHEVATYCAKRKQRLAVERSKISTKARELFTSALFGASHPYGTVFHESLYDDLTREQIIAFYRERYTAENCFVVCSGKIPEHQRDMIAALAAQIPAGGDIPAPSFADPAPIPFAFGAHEDAVQSSIRIGTLLFPRSHPDFIAMQVAATVLGGYFGSRLVRNLREQHGYTYGAFATVANLEYSGYLAIATEVATDATEDAMRQIFIEIARLRDELITDDELRMVKNILAGEVMRILDGPFGIADVTIENIQNGTDNSYINRFLEEVRDMGPDRIRDVARKYLSPEVFTTVVVGAPSLETVPVDNKTLTSGW